MKTILYALAALVIGFIIGFFGGHHYESISVKAGQTTAAHAETKAVVDGVNKQAVAQHTEAVAQQGISLALDAQKVGIQSHGFDLQAEINRAQFAPTKPAAIAVPKAVVVACRDDDDPVSSGEFLGLYDRAARGTDPATAASATTTRVH